MHMKENVCDVGSHKSARQTKAKRQSNCLSSIMMKYCFHSYLSWFFPQPTSPFHSVLALLMSCFVSACNAAHYNKNLCVEKLKWSRNCWCWEDEKTREEKHCSCFLFSCSIASDHYGFYDDINIIYLAQGHSWMTFKLSSIFPSKL